MNSASLEDLFKSSLTRSNLFSILNSLIKRFALAAYYRSRVFIKVFSGVKGQKRNNQRGRRPFLVLIWGAVELLSFVEYALIFPIVANLYGYSVESLKNFSTADKRSKNIPSIFKLEILLCRLNEVQIEELFQHALNLKSSKTTTINQ